MLTSTAPCSSTMFEFEMSEDLQFLLDLLPSGSVGEETASFSFSFAVVVANKRPGYLDMRQPRSTWLPLVDSGSALS